MKNVRVNAREVRVIEGLSYRDSTVVTNTDFNSSVSDVGKLKYISIFTCLHFHLLSYVRNPTSQVVNVSPYD